VRSSNSGRLASSALQTAAKASSDTSSNEVVVEELALERAHQADPRHHRAVLARLAHRLAQQRRPAGFCVHDGAVAVGDHLERRGDVERSEPAALGDGQEVGVRAARRVGVGHLAIRDRQALGGQHLDADVVDAGRDRALDHLG
jgi:hypothetical protein